MNKLSPSCLGSWLVAGLAGTLMGCTPPGPDTAGLERPVKAMVVTAGDEDHTRSFPGKVEAARRVELAFQVPGLLIELPVREGQNVLKGEVIGRLRPDDFQARLQTLQGQLDRARASLRALQSGDRPEERLRLEAQLRAAEARLANARAEYRRYAALVGTRAVARVDYDAAETAYRVAQEEFQSARQLLEQGTVARDEDIEAQEGEVRSLEGRGVEASLQLEDATLRAPFDGVIAQRFVEVNQNVRAKEPIVRFQDVDEIEVLVDVPETVMAADLRTADLVQLSAEFSGAPGVQFPVYLKEIAKAADPITQTFQVRVGPEYPALDPTGSFGSAYEMLELVIGSDSSGQLLRLGDVAEIQRGDQDPPRRLLRFDGQPAIGLGISTVQGGNVVRMGKAIRTKLAELKPNQPVGIEIGEINFQPEAVASATNDFIFNLIKAVSIVFVVLFLAMGRKTGIIIGSMLFLTIMGTFLVMYLEGNLLMERISLGALIIALCMLTDNAIIASEGLKVRMEAGEDKLKVVREVVAENQWPLFGATAIAVIAFAAIGLSEDKIGEYCNSLFWVILISLSLSWIAAITVTPLLGYLLFTPTQTASAGKAAYDNVLFRTYRKLLAAALRFRWLVLLATIGAFAASVYGFTHITQSFFPPAPGAELPVCGEYSGADGQRNTFTLVMPAE